MRLGLVRSKGKNGRQQVPRSYPSGRGTPVGWLGCARADSQKGKGERRSRSLWDDSQKGKGKGKSKGERRSRSLWDDSQKGNGNGNGKGNGNGNGNGKGNGKGKGKGKGKSEGSGTVSGGCVWIREGWGDGAAEG